MVFPAAAKQKQADIISDEDSSDVSDESDFKSDMEEEDQESEQNLKATWRSLSPPVLESVLLGNGMPWCILPSDQFSFSSEKSQSDS